METELQTREKALNHPNNKKSIQRALVSLQTLLACSREAVVPTAQWRHAWRPVLPSSRTRGKVPPRTHM